ncbi:MAG: hypothetical protein J7639_13345 [Paenibacillaceae bacterium]|nr:hypothetical protein [Paenibacillaceae bacterium]
MKRNQASRFSQPLRGRSAPPVACCFRMPGINEATSAPLHEAYPGQPLLSSLISCSATKIAHEKRPICPILGGSMEITSENTGYFLVIVFKSAL